MPTITMEAWSPVRPLWTRTGSDIAPLVLDEDRQLHVAHPDCPPPSHSCRLLVAETNTRPSARQQRLSAASGGTSIRPSRVDSRPNLREGWERPTRTEALA